MNVLEKILEEIEEKRESLVDVSDDEMELCDVEDWYDEGVKAGRMKTYLDVAETIRSHMDEVPNCGKCSRRQWYQKGIEDGKKDNDWIPVEEKLPEEDERYKGRKVIDVLVTTAKGKVTKVQRQSHNDYWWWGRIYGEPTAWQPLQEPYKKHRQ